MSALRKQQLLEDTLAVTAATTQTITAVPTHLGNPGWSDFLAMALVAFFMILVFWILLRLSKKWTQTMYDLYAFILFVCTLFSSYYISIYSYVNKIGWLALRKLNPEEGVTATHSESRMATHGTAA